MTVIATYGGRPDRAVQTALRGIAQVPLDHPLAIQLRVKAARAYARLGDRDNVETLFTEARRLHDRMPTQTPSWFTLDTAARASYAIAAYPAQAYRWLGDFPAAKTHSEAALAVHEAAPPGGSSPGMEAMARLVLAIALAHLGAPEEAAAHGRQVLASSVSTAYFLRSHARDLCATLTTHYPTLPCVRDFHEQYRHMLAGGRELAPVEPEWMRLAWQLAGEIRQRRKTAKLSQPQLAHRIGYTKQYVSLAERPQRGLPSANLVQAIDTALGADGALVTLHEQAETARKACRAGTQPHTMAAEEHTSTPEATTGGGPGQAPDRTEVTTSKRREVLGAAAVAPEILNQVLSEAADEAMEFTRHAGTSAVGRGTLEHLELVLTDLNQGYDHESRTEQFVVARAYRARVDELIRGRHTLAELRELYVYAGSLSELLAYLTNDLGHHRTARAYAIDSYTYAEQAGHGELQGWAADVMTTIATYAERPDQAAQAALRGIAHVPLDHPLAVQLRVKAARAYARLGDRDTFKTLFTEAQRLHDRMPTQTPRRFGLDTATMASYAIAAYPAQAYRWLEDLPAAKTHSEVALAVHESAPPGASTPGKEAMARLVLATTLTHLGAPDEAVALGHQALPVAGAAKFLQAHARDLNSALTTHYPTLPCVRDFREQYRHVLDS